MLFGGIFFFLAQHAALEMHPLGPASAHRHSLHDHIYRIHWVVGVGGLDDSQHPTPAPASRQPVFLTIDLVMPSGCPTGGTSDLSAPNTSSSSGYITLGRTTNHPAAWKAFSSSLFHFPTTVTKKLITKWMETTILPYQNLSKLRIVCSHISTIRTLIISCLEHGGSCYLLPHLQPTPCTPASVLHKASHSSREQVSSLHKCPQ